VDGAAECIIVRQVFRRSEQHDHVPIVAAGMHLPLIEGSIRKTGSLRYIKGIHIGPKADGWLFPVSSRDRRDNSCSGKTLINIESERNQFFSDEGRCFLLCKRRFRLSVEFMTPPRHFFNHASDLLINRHCSFSPYFMNYTPELKYKKIDKKNYNVKKYININGFTAIFV
jgi:hypothetical protein